MRSLSILAFILLSFASSCGAAPPDPRSRSAVEQILQQVIDSERLDKYFHADELPGRKPLRVLKSEIVTDEIHLMKFGQKVELISAKDASGAYLEFPKIDISSERATVEFRYRVEGLRGEAELAKQGESWLLKSIALREN